MIVKRLVRLLLGLFLYAIGIVLAVKANLGLSPWHAFHQGLAISFGLTLGTAIKGVGLIILLFNFFMKEKIGFGTLMNMVLIGTFVDWLMAMPNLPESVSLLSGILSVTISMFIIATATWLYIGAGFGAGPRDGMMVSLTKTTNLPVGLIRGIIESLVLIVGFFLGGSVGIGTVITAFMIGPIVQFTFKCLKFDVKTIEHDYLSLKPLRKLFA